MITPYRIRIGQDSVPAAWVDGKYLVLTGSHAGSYERDAVKKLEKWTTFAQSQEWYGDEDHVGDPEHGRYKNKGGEQLVFWLSEEEMYYTDAEAVIIEYFARAGRFMKYIIEPGSLEPYSEPIFFDFKPELAAFVHAD